MAKKRKDVIRSMRFKGDLYSKLKGEALKKEITVASLVNDSLCEKYLAK